MKFFVIFALTVATVSAFDLRNAELKQGNVSVMESEARILNGIKASEGQFPYQVGLLLTIPNEERQGWCSGSIISKTYVLTNAICLQGPTAATIYFGATNRFSPEKTVSVDRANFIIHEDFNSKTLENNIGLIKFPAIAFTNKIQPIDLPHDISCGNPNLVDRDALVSGWGHPVEAGKVDTFLRYTTNKIIRNDECYKENDFDTNICLRTSKDSSPCSSDAGALLVLPSENYLIGVYSFGYKYCDQGIPAVFVRVSKYMPWIRKHTDIAS